MKLLDAINTVLPYLGEANVTSTTARNTTVQAVLQQIDTAKRTLLGTGWWFNRVKVTLYPGVDGRIKAPINVLSWLPDEGISEIRGEYLYNLDTGDYQFSSALTGMIIQDMDFEELPNYAALYVTYSAALAVYSADLGVDSTYQVELGKNLATASMYLEREHLRKSNLNIGGNRGGKGRFLSALRS